MQFFKKFYDQNKGKIFSGQDSRFQLQTCLLIAFIPVIAFSFTGFILWIFLNMIHIFFEANGLMVHQDLRGAFIDAIFQETFYIIPYLGVFTTALFFLGYYISNLLLRPFKFISDYTIKVYQNPGETFSPNTINEFKLPISFGIKFFHYLSEARKIKKIAPSHIEPQFKNIENPIFDIVFFCHYFLFLSLACAIATWGLYLFTVDMHDRIVELSLSLLKTHSHSLVHFLKKQEETLDTVITISSSILFISYIMLGKVIVSKVNGVSYNFFKTMREFMLGNFNARVRLRKNDPGHSYADSLNTLLDHVVKEEIKEITWNSAKKDQTDKVA